ncbi:MAG: 6-carboxytetrahydropterin synthase [Desulfovibrionaceae bacterium]|nr:6-carboxytetrahydropterin synthase [Desulfovibrionaceae bacterium]MBF0512811.1 6-carboxytetrahydropterin synthase [Desulfovibrionaceae bacterium]
MAGVFEITVTGGFCAAHRLPGHAGACARVHGHNFAVTARLSAPDTGEPDRSGMVMDFLDIKAILDSVLGELDHKDLNALPAFQNAPPTAELLARHIFGRIKTALAATTAAAPAPVRLARVTVRETKDFAAGYSED